MTLSARFLRRLRFAAVAAVAGAAVQGRGDSGFPAAPAKETGAYFDENLVGKPAGVYEWEGRLFALARVPQEDSFALAKASAMSAATLELRKWAVERSDEASPLFPKEPGLAACLRLHRKYFSGDDAAWLWHSSSSQSFLDDSGDEFVFAICVPKKDVLDSLPVPGTGDGLPGNWSDYLRSLVLRRYVREPDSEFLLDCAAPDAVLARETLRVSRALAGASATNFVEEARSFLSDEVSRNPFGAPFSAQASFEAVQKRLAAALPASGIANAIRARATAFESQLAAAAKAAGTNAVASAETNAVASAGTNDAPAVDSTNDVASVLAPPAPALDPPAVLDAERMFLTAGRFPGTPDTDPAAAALARRAFVTKAGGLTGKREALWALLSERPGIADGWNYLGRILREEGAVPEAVACFRCALRLKPDHEFAWANLALAYRDLGDPDLAVATALVARGLASDPWAVKETEAILSAPSSSDGGRP